jgi:prefoldin subunit 5
MSDTTKDLADAVEGLKEVIELLDAQMDMIGDGAAMINTEISRICEEQMESLKRSIEYISRCGVEEEKYTKKWKAL